MSDCIDDLCVDPVCVPAPLEPSIGFNPNPIEDLALPLYSAAWRILRAADAALTLWGLSVPSQQAVGVDTVGLTAAGECGCEMMTVAIKAGMIEPGSAKCCFPQWKWTFEFVLSRCGFDPPAGHGSLPPGPPDGSRLDSINGQSVAVLRDWAALQSSMFDAYQRILDCEGRRMGGCGLEVVGMSWVAGSPCRGLRIRFQAH